MDLQVGLKYKIIKEYSGFGQEELLKIGQILIYDHQVYSHYDGCMIYRFKDLNDNLLQICIEDFYSKLDRIENYIEEIF